MRLTPLQNRSNYTAHFTTTGPEIWRQTNGHLHAFVSGAGTGGTLAGIGRYLKSIDENVRVVMPDPDGSGLYNKVSIVMQMVHSGVADHSVC